MKNILVKIIVLLISIFMVKAQEQHGIQVKYMDKSVKPQNDFYNYTNGNWMKTAVIPADRSRWGSFDELREFTDSVSLGILKKSMQTTYKQGEDGQKVADLYKSFTDWDARNKVGIAPLKAKFAEIDKIKNLKELQEYFIKETPSNGNALYGFYVSAHMKDSKRNTLYMGAADLGLGRDYYQKNDENSMEVLEKYLGYLKRLSDYTGIKFNTNATDVVAFEKHIANYLKTVEELRDSKKRYNPVAVKDINKMVKNVDMVKYLSSFDIKIDSVIIPEIKYYQKIDELINEPNLPLIKDYLKVTMANQMTGNLNQDLDNLSFEFYGKELRGQKEQRSMDKRGLQVVNGSLGEVLGKLYVSEVFPPEAKEAAKNMVSYIVGSFQTHIKNLTWMSDVTKQKALQKLSMFTVKIGYPDKWKDYSKLNIVPSTSPNAYLTNIGNIRKWRFEDNLGELKKPVDKTKWGMTPQTVNAYYNSSNNEIVFPAAILQPPFYDYKADMAVNFGGIGAVIGHEISHGFDDSGSQYDGNGNLNNWWTKEDSEKFKAAGDALAKQYSAYEPLPGVYVNGKFTLGENIADLGGISVAYDALHNYLADNGDPGLIDGFTPDQRLYLSWATVWRTKATDKAVANQVKTDPHSPGYFRAIGPLENQVHFFQAFDVKPGDKMYKADPIIIW